MLIKRLFLDNIWLNEAIILFQWMVLDMVEFEDLLALI
jgi:hypothetical protein